MSSLRQQFLQHLAQTSEFPLMLEIVSGSGMYLYDKEGKPYMDLIAGIGVSCLGHSHPAVVEAAKKQLDQYMHTMVYGEYVLSPQVDLATLITNQLPDSLDAVYLVNSGTEATEGAMKLAKRYTGRYEIIACKKAYHGSSQGAASLMNDDYFTQAYRPLLPGIRHIEYNCDFCLRQITNKTAAVIMEPVQAEWGIRPPLDGYLQKVRDRCNETGTLLIFDEIQTGYGRSGHLFAFQKYGVIPDIMLIAKGMGGGMPIGGFVSSQKILKVFTNNPLLGHITTFGGHPVSSAAALATLQTLLKEKLYEQVPEKEKLFIDLLKHDAIIEVRHAGLMIGVELESFEMVQAVIKKCLDQGLIVDWFLFNDRTIRIAPPLVITEAEIREACGILIGAIELCA